MERDSQGSSDGMLLLQGHIHPRGASCRPSWRATEGPRGSVMSHCSSKSSSEPPGCTRPESPPPMSIDAGCSSGAAGSHGASVCIGALPPSEEGASSATGAAHVSERSGAARMVEATQHKPSKATQVCVIHRSACRP